MRSGTGRAGCTGPSRRRRCGRRPAARGVPRSRGFTESLSRGVGASTGSSHEEVLALTDLTDVEKRAILALTTGT